LNNAIPTVVDQFRAFQDLMQQGEFNAAATTAEALLRERLTPVQRALVLQLQGDVQQRLNNREAAERCWRASLDLRFTPELALRLQDPAGLAELPARGHGRELARTMANTLQRYPLQQQQRALLTDLEQEPRLAALVHQLRRLMPER
jgi:hypothetical protein